MKILVLRGKNPSPVSRIIQEGGDEVLEREDPIDVKFVVKNKINFIVSHNYWHIIRPEVVDVMPSRIINLHIAYLPWNRGRHPNLWSFLEDTPKGVTIHYIDAGVDTGDIIYQREINFAIEHETLATTYNKLQEDICRLFEQTWPSIRDGQCPRKQQSTQGSFHTWKDTEPFMPLLVQKWDTPVSLLCAKAKR